MERKSYRKSPGRQYGYEYDPLRSRAEGSRSRKLEDDERWTTRGTTGSGSGILLAQRPDPRRTRQLLRQNIIASKTRMPDAESGLEEQQEIERSPLEGQEEGNLHSRHPDGRGSRNGYLARPSVPSTRELEEAGERVDKWDELRADLDIDPDPGYEELPDERLRYSSRRLVRPSEYDDEDDDYDDDERPSGRKGKMGKISRRGLLVGVGAAAVVGTGVAAYQYAPKIPQALGDAGANIERQLQDAFNKGVAQGAEAARKEILIAMENLEGFTLEGAMTAARLTRVAYDVFVSPLIQNGANVATDFLTAMLNAFKKARMLLAGVYQDNATLQAMQKVLESWVDQVKSMPKQLNAITQADLDGAQAYLRALQRKVEEEKKKLSGENTAPENKSTPGLTPMPTQKP